jgi:hypothetical protein
MYKKAVSLDPTYANSHYMLGQLYQNRGNIDKAVAEFTKHIRIHETGNMAEDAMRRIAEMKSMTFEDVRELFSLYVDEKPEGMSKQPSVPVQMEKQDEKDYMKNLKDKMADKKTIPPAATQQAEPSPSAIHNAAQSFSPVTQAPAATAAAKAIDPNEYMRLMKEKMRRKMAGEPDFAPASAPAQIAPAPPPPFVEVPSVPSPAPVIPPPSIQQPQDAPIMPDAAPQPIFEVINDNSQTANIIDLPPRPNDNPWGSPEIIETRLDEPSAEYGHTQHVTAKPSFDSGAFAQLPEMDMETMVENPGVEPSAGETPGLKRQPRPLAMNPVEPVHGSGIQSVGAISHIMPSATAPLAPRHPITPQVPLKPHPAEPGEKEPPQFELKKDDDGKPKITRNYY